ncbi:hypothetical protein OROMI_008387 [Orobanche minor]
MLCKSTSYSFSPITSRIWFDHAVSPSLIVIWLSSTIAAALVSKSISTRTVDHNMLKTTPNSFSPIASRCAASLSTITISKLCVTGQSVHSFAHTYSNADISSPNGQIKSPSSTSLKSVSCPTVDQNMLKATPNSISPIASRCATSLSTLTISKLSVAAQLVHSFARAYSNAAISLPNGGINSNVSVSSTSQVALIKHVPLIRTFGDRSYRSKKQSQVSHTSPKDPVIELALLQSVDDDKRHTSDWSTIRDQTETDIEAEVEAMEIEFDERISNCVALIWKFANEYLIDNEKRDSLGNYLAKRGFETGKYHNSSDFIQAVDDYFGVKACVIKVQKRWISSMCK